MREATENHSPGSFPHILSWDFGLDFGVLKEPEQALSEVLDLRRPYQASDFSLSL